MKLVLPREHRFRGALEARGVAVVTQDAQHEAALPLRRIGIVNLMPKAEAYEELLLGVLGEATRVRARVSEPGQDFAFEPVWIRLSSHAYKSSDAAHLARVYLSFDQAVTTGLSGLILTGAPVEELPFHSVRYWDELVELLTWSRTHFASTLGLCWGAMALAKLLDLEKHTLPKKLFGVFPMQSSGIEAEPLWCAQSRHSEVLTHEIERAAAASHVRLLAHSPEVGHSVFQSGDGRFLMHQGHPEYRAERLIFEYERDRLLGRTDVDAPRHLDLQHPEASFRSHGPQFFASWLRGLL